MDNALVLAIVGATASGKSSLAARLAQELSSAVVSVDAMQVYRGMDIGTAKEPPEKRTTPLYMIDVVDPDQNYSVSLFQRDARAIIDQLLSEQKTPVLAGGTGLYLNAVLDEMDFPKGHKTTKLRQELEIKAEALGPQGIHAELLALDPKSAELIHPHNVKRVVRALEMYYEGKSYAEQHANLHKRKAHYHARIYGISWDREVLYERINKRVDSMLEMGLLDEVKRLVEHGYSEALTSSQAIGYKELIEYLEGRLSFDEAVAYLKKRTRNYAKRQINWFGHDERVHWLDYNKIQEDDAVELILSDIARN